MEEEDDTLPLSKVEQKYVQEIIGVFLYYARAVNITMMTALGYLATRQATPTKNRMRKIRQLLNYAVTHPDAIVTVRASDTILTGHSNTSYLSKSK